MNPASSTEIPADGVRDTEVVVIACAVALALVLRAQPIWTIGFYQDDAVISGWGQEAALAGQSGLAYCYSLAKAMFLTQGRLAFAGVLLLLPMQLAIADNLLLFRVTQSAAQLAALGAFMLFAKALSKSARFALSCGLVFVAIFEVRNYHDAAYGYFVLYPFLIATGSLSCYFAVRCSEEAGERLGLMFWAIPVLHTVGMLTYEMAIPFCVVSCLILACHGHGAMRTRLLRSIIAGLPVLMLAGVGIVAKSMMSIYEGTRIGTISFRAIGDTYIKQLFAGMPLSYWLCDPHQLFEDLMRDPRVYPQALVPAVAIGIATASALFFGVSRLRAKHPALLLLVGSVLLLVPSSLISVSAKYQKDSVVGVGYSQTVISYLGVSVIVVIGSAFTFKRLLSLHRPSAVAFACAVSGVVGLVAAISLASSCRTAEAINESWRYPREKMDVWMHASLPRGDGRELIVVDRSSLFRWETSPYVTQQRGTLGKFVTRSEYLSSKESVPRGTTVTLLRHPEVLHPTDISLFVEASSTERGGTWIRGYAICASKLKLSMAALSMSQGAQRWAIPMTVLPGRHGYFYRKIKLHVESGDVNEFALETSSP